MTSPKPEVWQIPSNSRARISVPRRATETSQVSLDSARPPLRAYKIWSRQQFAGGSYEAEIPAKFRGSYLRPPKGKRDHPWLVAFISISPISCSKLARIDRRERELCSYEC